MGERGGLSGCYLPSQLGKASNFLVLHQCCIILLHAFLYVCWDQFSASEEYLFLSRRTTELLLQYCATTIMLFHPVRHSCCRCHRWRLDACSFLPSQSSCQSATTTTTAAAAALIGGGGSASSLQCCDYFYGLVIIQRQKHTKHLAK